MADLNNTIYIEHLEITEEEILADEKLQEDVEQQGLLTMFVTYQEATANIINSIKRGSETTEMPITLLLQQPHKLAPEIPVEFSPYQSLKSPLHKYMLQQSPHHQPVEQSHHQLAILSPQEPVKLLPQQLVKLSHHQPVEQSPQELVILAPQQPVELLPQPVEQSHQQPVEQPPQQLVKLSHQQAVEQSPQQLVLLSPQQPVELLPQPVEQSPQQPVEQSPQQPVEQSPQQLVKLSPQQPVELLRQQQIEQSLQQPVQLSRYQSSKLLLKQSYQTIPTNQPQVLGTSETCSRRNSTDSINYYCNSGQESGDPNPMEVVVTLGNKISNIIDMNRYYHTSHTTTELSTNYYELP